MRLYLFRPLPKIISRKLPERCCHVVHHWRSIRSGNVRGRVSGDGVRCLFRNADAISNLFERMSPGVVGLNGFVSHADLTHPTSNALSCFDRSGLRWVRGVTRSRLKWRIRVVEYRPLTFVRTNSTNPCSTKCSWRGTVRASFVLTVLASGVIWMAQ